MNVTLEDVIKRLDVREHKVVGNLIQAGTYWQYKGYDSTFYAFVYDVENGELTHNFVSFTNDNTVVYKRKVTRTIEEFLSLKPVKIDCTEYMGKLTLAKNLIV